MPFSPQEYKDWLPQMPPLGSPIRPSEKAIGLFLENLKFLDHHDEYYAIRDLRNFGFTWRYGIHRCLGYDDDEWTHELSLSVIHDDYRSLFIWFGSLAYEVINNPPTTLSALKHRYIINVPIRKKSGSYVWVKQMSMPLRLDENNRMVLQMNCYTVVSKFQGINLPLLPRIFGEKGERLRELENQIFQNLLGRLKLQFDERHLKTLQAFVDIDFLKRKNEHKATPSPIRISAKEVGEWDAENTGIQSTRTIHEYNHSLSKIMKETFNHKFMGVHEIALFLKGLGFLKVSEKYFSG
jgi:hypothetical protein